MSAAPAPRFAPLLRSIIAHELKRAFSDVAREIGMDPRNFHSRITGRVSFTPEEINLVLRAIPDPRLVDALLVLTPLICAQRTSPAPRDPAASHIELAARALERSLEVMRDAIHLGLADKPSEPGPPERIALIHQHIQDAQRQLGALQMSLHVRPSPPPSSWGGSRPDGSIRSAVVLEQKPT
jgi:hypothetical protein